MSLPCPACGFLTIAEDAYGTFEICEVCGWEDDALQLANPACGGGANRESLIEAQRRVLADRPLGSPGVDGIVRDRSWRPLDANAVATAIRERDAGAWANAAISDPRQAYWRRG